MAVSHADASPGETSANMADLDYLVIAPHPDDAELVRADAGAAEEPGPASACSI